MILYSNSDSCGILSTTKNRYPEFLGAELSAKVFNNGKSGSCNRRIFRNTVRDLISIKESHPEEKILAVICLGSLLRNEWWDEKYIPSYEETDGHFQSFQLHMSPNNTKKQIYKFSQEWYKLYNDEAEQTNMLLDLVLLTTWFKSNNIEYIIFASNNITYKKIDYNDIFIKNFSKLIFQDPNILNINDFSFTKFCLDKNYIPYDFDLYQNYGHHGEEAHKEFADFLLNFYKTNIEKL